MNILITGASRGIGRAIAVALAAPGRTLLINYLQNEAAAEETARLVRAQGGEALVLQGNVRSEDDNKRLAKAFDEVDVLVHNAAVGALKPYDKLRTSHWDLTLESSLRPFWMLTKLCRLREGGNVIGVSSLGSRSYIPGYAAMGAAKAGMEALTRQLAVELAPRKVRVNTVCVQYFAEGKQMIETTEKLTPLGRVGEPEDIAGAVKLLLMPEARWITGQVLVVDGGFSLL